jgi:hypothetical protein
LAECLSAVVIRALPRRRPEQGEPERTAPARAARRSASGDAEDANGACGVHKSRLMSPGCIRESIPPRRSRRVTSLGRAELASRSVGRSRSGGVKFSAMRAVGVVMLDEDAEHLGELPSVEDEEPIQTFGIERSGARYVNSCYA